MSNLVFKTIKGITCETGDAFFNDRLHQITIMPAEILFPVISDHIDPATDQKGNAMANSQYQFKKRQKELAKKKKKEKKSKKICLELRWNVPWVCSLLIWNVSKSQEQAPRRILMASCA